MKQLKSTKIQKELIRKSLDESVSMILGIDESFTRKIRSKKNDELTTKADTAFVPDGVYILHETLGVKGVEDWNPKNNNGVVGILLIEDDHKIVVATEDAPDNLRWSKKRGLINQPVKKKKTLKRKISTVKCIVRNLTLLIFPLRITARLIIKVDVVGIYRLPVNYG